MYVNKCSKCGAEFETKNPKRIICPDCLYPDKNPINLKNFTETLAKPKDDVSEQKSSYSSSNDQQREGGYQGREGGYQQREGGYQGREDGYQQREGGYQRREGGYQQREGGYQRREGGYQQREGGYQRREGGYQQREGGYQRREGGYQQREGGYQRREGGYQQREGGYQRREGGYQQREGGYQRREGGYQQREGGYQRREGGYQQREGGYQRREGGYQQREGGYQRREGGYQQREGGYQRREGGFGRPSYGGNRGPAQNRFRRPAVKRDLLVSREQVADIEKLYMPHLPLPNPDIHEVIAKEVELEPNKVFFAINLIRQKLRLPKLPFPKRKLAVSPEQLDAIKNLYEPLLPLPPIGCHKIIAKQLKMDEWRVHVGIGIIRKQMELPRWNHDRADAPEEFKNKEIAEDVVKTEAKSE